MHQIKITTVQLFVINERCQIVRKIASFEIEEWIGELPIYKTSCDLQVTDLNLSKSNCVIENIGLPKYDLRPENDIFGNKTRV